MKTDNARLNVDFLLAIAFFHAGAAVAIFYYGLSYFWLALIIWPFSHGIGLAVGYHRLLTHRGFKVHPFLEYLITICGTLCLQGEHIKWIAIHRVHHKETDRVGDPHSPRDGFWYAHIGWMIWGDREFRTKEFLIKYAKDLYNDRWHYLINKFWMVPSMILGLILFLWGGLPYVLWGIFVPVTFGLHFTWSVNSFCHFWGSRPNDTGEDSTNNVLVAAVTFGEGWHNNHHDQQTRARHGIGKYQIDLSWMFIWTLGKLGLATKIKT